MKSIRFAIPSIDRVMEVLEKPQIVSSQTMLMEFIILFGMWDNKYFIINLKSEQKYLRFNQKYMIEARVMVGKPKAMTPIKTASSNDKNGNKCCLLFLL